VLTEESHAGCPGHAAVVSEHDPEREKLVTPFSKVVTKWSPRPTFGVRFNGSVTGKGA
jgi:hypothetical protein